MTSTSTQSTSLKVSSAARYYCTTRKYFPNWVHPLSLQEKACIVTTTMAIASDLRLGLTWSGGHWVGCIACLCMILEYNWHSQKKILVMIRYSQVTTRAAIPRSSHFKGFPGKKSRHAVTFVGSPSRPASQPACTACMQACMHGLHALLFSISPHPFVNGLNEKCILTFCCSPFFETRHNFIYYLIHLCKLKISN